MVCNYVTLWILLQSESVHQVDSANHSSALHPPSPSHNLHYGYSVGLFTFLQFQFFIFQGFVGLGCCPCLHLRLSHLLLRQVSHKSQSWIKVLMNYIECLFIGLSAASGVNCFATTMSHSGKRLPGGFFTKGCDVKLQKKRMVFNFGSISNSSSHGPSWWSKASQSIQCRKQSILSPLEALNIFCHPQKSETGDQRVREVLIAWSTPLERFLFEIFKYETDLKWKKYRNLVLSQI